MISTHVAPEGPPGGPAEVYNDKVVRRLTIMMMIWGIVGMAVGVLIAAQLIWPALDFGLRWRAAAVLQAASRFPRRLYGFLDCLRPPTRLAGVGV